MLNGPLPTTPAGVGIIDKFDNILSRVLGGINGAAAGATTPSIAGSPAIYGTGAEPAPAADYTPLIIIALIVVAIVVMEK